REQVGPSVGREHRTYARADRAHVDAAGRSRFDDAHDLAEILDAHRAGRFDAFCDQRVEVGVAERLGQVRLQHLDLGFFLVHEILAAAGAILSDRVAALLDHAFDDALHSGVVEWAPRVDLALLNARQRQPQNTQTRLVAAAHRGL